MAIMEPPVTGRGVMKIMGRMGDEKVLWDMNDSKQVLKARTRFADLRAKGHRAFIMDATGKKGKPLDDFDPSAGAILMVPPLVGG